MTVQDLIDKLMAIEDKTKPIVQDAGGYWRPDIEVHENKESVELE